jgi:lysophospholipase L1-like esterase
MSVIFCFGDSNTWGCRPVVDRTKPPKRYGPGDRWPDVMANALGPGFTVVSDGLNGRTTIFDDPIEGMDKNGRRALVPQIESHRPVDLVLIMLGTNDLKSRFAVSGATIAAGAGELAALAAGTGFGPDGEPPRVLLVAPPATCVDATSGTFGDDFSGADQRSARFGDQFARVAMTVGADFFDAGSHARSSEVDGIHLSAGSQRRLGRALAEWVSEQLRADRATDH